MIGKLVNLINTEFTVMKSFIIKLLLLLAIIPAVAQENIPGKRAHHSLIYDDALGKVILTGGSTPLNGGSSFVFYDDVWSFDGKAWKKEAVTGDQRSGVGLAYDSKNGKIMSMGGFSPMNTTLGDLRELSGTRWKPVKDVSDMAAAEGTFVYDSDRDKFVFFGGSKSRGMLRNTTWEWDRTDWKKIETAGPEARQAHAMVYDSKRKKIVLFGGTGGTPNDKYGDTWEFDGTIWMKVSNEGPGFRMSMGYAYDSKSGLFIIFGGAGANGIMSDTWAWDGKEWKQLATSGPTPRMMGYMAYDRKRDRVVLFGGRLGWPNDANDTWEFDGVSWKEVMLK